MYRLTDHGFLSTVSLLRKSNSGLPETPYRNDEDGGFPSIDKPLPV